jgi:hypothetical protein
LRADARVPRTELAIESATECVATKESSMKSNLPSVFIASTVLAALVTFGVRAHAVPFTRRQGSMSCMPDPEQVSLGLGKWVIGQGQLAWTIDTQNAGKLFCSLLEDDTLPMTSVSAFGGVVSVHGWDGNNVNFPGGLFKASACITFFDGGGGACGTASMTSPTFSGVVGGTAGLGIADKSQWASGTKDPKDFPYVFVEVPAVTITDNRSSLWGVNWSKA